MTDLISEEQIPAMAQESVGLKLARAREAQDMSVADVARALRLGVKQIEAIEANDYAKLPGRTFVRGFVRNYARLLNLDPDRLVVENFPAQKETETQDIQAPSQRISFSEHHRKPWLKRLAISFVAVALISWGVLVWLGPESVKPVMTSRPDASTLPALSAEMPDTLATRTPEVVAAAEKNVQSASPPLQDNASLAAAAPAAAPPAPAPAPAVAPAASAGHVSASLVFSGPTWVEVRDKNGKKIHSQNNLAGTQQTVEGEPPLSLVIGSAPNVKLTYKGQPVDLAPYTRADVARLTLE